MTLQFNLKMKDGNHEKNWVENNLRFSILEDIFEAKFKVISPTNLASYLVTPFFVANSHNISGSILWFLDIPCTHYSQNK